MLNKIRDHSPLQSIQANGKARFWAQFSYFQNHKWILKEKNNDNLSVVVLTYKQPSEEHEMEIYSVLISANLEDALHLADCFL